MMDNDQIRTEVDKRIFNPLVSNGGLKTSSFLSILYLLLSYTSTPLSGVTFFRPPVAILTITSDSDFIIEQS